MNCVVGRDENSTDVDRKLLDSLSLSFTDSREENLDSKHYY